MNKTLGAAAIIAGTTIGAGMLALPIVAQTLGLPLSMGMLILMWALMYYAGLVSLEINSVAGTSPVSIGVLAGRSFGPWAETLMTVVLTGLFYALLAAYMTGGSSILHGVLEQQVGHPIRPMLVSLGFAGLFATITALRMVWLDYVNRLLVAIKILVFGWIIGQMLPFIKVNPETPLALSTTCWIALPVVFTSFGFHGSIPSMMHYLQNDAQQVRQALRWGTIVPLCIYMLWCATVLSIVPATGEMSFATIAAEGGDVGALVRSLTWWAAVPNMPVLITLFSLLAIITSFFGVGVGLLDFFRDHLARRRPRLANGKRTVISAALTYALPLVFALFYPRGFLMALGYAAIALALLALTMPVLIALQQRHDGVERLYTVAGGCGTLWGALAVSVALIGLEIVRQIF